MALASLVASDMDKMLLRATAFTGIVFGITDVAVACVSIATWITSNKFLGNGMVVFLTSLSLGDLFLSTGGLGIIPIIGGWSTLDKEMMQLTMSLRDMPMMVQSVLQPLMIALLCIQFYLHITGNTRLSSTKISVVLAILAWFYAVLLIGAVILFYAKASDDIMKRIAVLRLPMAWLPGDFMRAWYILNVFVWVVIGAVLSIVCFTRSPNAVQPLNESSESPGCSSPRILIVQVIVTALTWLPYSLYTVLVEIDLMKFSYKPLITIMFTPELRKNFKAVLKCKCL
ncbi:hypothetical protein CAPTEDRAFT_215985 [Capitella teleta]|uniref:G-protein coupled receptors family 1 profile domain-containing protein n=1 Tax=Capitella teleta TaxID=283909 RepID=R7V8G5_CAPTE|nr:hypothetical protein CAPTEDRAFT_215985 [Capitella teleta]|eukprot:ELU15138.1 hypothetical protein CAPTEDRAFT_215985 [Capitella teleta]